jgi:glucose-1-phosphate cytidylyltransferase
MQVVILAGGLGTRISEESVVKPKPLIDIGGKPILWHIMKIYSSFGLNDFIICCGYKGYTIKEYFANYFNHMSNLTFDMRENTVQVHERFAEPWKVTVVDTGEATLTGGRLKRIANYLDDGDFCFTYGDGVADVDIKETIKFHQNNKKLCTVTAVQPPGRFGSLKLTGDRVDGFLEKPKGDGNWINGGFFVADKSVLDAVTDDFVAWEDAPMRQLALQGELSGFKHKGFWHAMDTMRDKNYLNELWSSNQAPWRVW